MEARERKPSFENLSRLSFEFYAKDAQDQTGWVKILKSEPALESLDSFFAVLAEYSESKERTSISSALNNNSPNAFGRFRLTRGVSAYFLTTPEEVNIAWGKIDEEGKTAKLHDFLNLEVKTYHAAKRSGHLSQAYYRNYQLFVAQIDSVSCYHSVSQEIMGRGENSIIVIKDEGFPEFHIVQALAKKKVLPLSSDGYPILTPDTFGDYFRILARKKIKGSTKQVNKMAPDQIA